MKVYDFNVHLPDVKSDDVNVVINQDMNLSVENIFNAFNIHSSFIKSVEGCNFLLFNTKLFDNGAEEAFKKEATKYMDRNSFTALVDFRRHDIFDYVDVLSGAGVKSIMFNSYLQRISDADFIDVARVCKYASEKGMFICIDGSYGTSKMYSYDNIKLACFVADLVSNVPIVIIHSGGYRVIEAMWLAMDKKNVWLDTSFSLPYYIGSSLEQDYAFAYKHIGTDRVVYGSDHPYENSMDALNIHMEFFKKYKFSDKEIENILLHNPRRLVGFE